MSDADPPPVTRGDVVDSDAPPMADGGIDVEQPSMPQRDVADAERLARRDALLLRLRTVGGAGPRPPWLVHRGGAAPVARSEGA
ncbi:hypothetical protein CTKZ_34130 [Cellulomonas algicola]|uniref:Uncharacterized protein n=1 Tax=Cellulomonas algicola TaxID=2071633 RepID=A0A401V4Q1_9CELL|nr:hypothetical protein [Cellulomonas algicola]GCD21851.1 hypothetical protein CTKZ_34130 [Cellulomonas algicola]